MDEDMTDDSIDFGGLWITANADIKRGQFWIGPVGEAPSKRLIDAFTRGDEVTKGGMAEAGWQAFNINGDTPPETSPND